ncbi:MAG TPA: flavodoxin family protein [Candidatus Atribacteria bacterium]|jgi:multimeric flavodoxin WrbA|nr:flavodoxin family protein [Candidatus Atribacteria bacterium]
MNTQVKIVGVSGSPRKGATQYCVQEALLAATEISGIGTEFIDLRGKEIHPCIHCNRCIQKQLDYCPVFADNMRDYYNIILHSDGLILGSPVYQMSPTAQIQAFINRLRPLGHYITKGYWATKVGGAIAVGGTRNGGQETTLESLNNFFFCTGMIVVSGGIFAYNGAAVWSNDKKEQGAKEDNEGMDSVRILGRRVALIAKILKVGLASLTEPIEGAILAGFPNQKELDRKIEKFIHR